MKRILIILLGILFSFVSMEHVKAQYGKPLDDELLERADDLYRVGKYKESKKAFEYALAKNNYRVGSAQWVIAKIGIGVSSLDQGDKSGADLLFEADSLKDADLPLEMQAFIRMQLAWGHRVRGNWDKRNESYFEALEMAEKSGDEFRTAQLQMSAGNVLVFKREHKRAITYLYKSISYLRKTDYYLELSLALENLHYAYSSIGLLELAEQYLLESIEINLKSGNKDLLNNDYRLAGDLYNRMGKYDLSIVYYSKQLEIAEEVARDVEVANIYRNIGAVYYSLGDLNSALKYYNLSAKIRVDEGFEPDGLTFFNIGLIYHELGEYNLAEELFLKTLTTYKDSEYWEARVYNELARLKTDLEEYEEALSYADRAKSISSGQESLSLQAQILKTISSIYTKTARFNLALDYARQSYEIASVSKGIDFTSSIIELSKAYKNIESDSAYYYSEMAFTEIEGIRENIFGDDLQVDVFKSYVGFYATVAEWYISEKQDFEKAFEIVERSKSRSLVDQLAIAREKNVLVDKTTQIRIQEKAKKVDRLYRELENSNSVQDQSKIEEQILAAELEYHTTINEMSIVTPELRAKKTNEVLGSKEIIKMMDSKTAVLEYATIDDKLLTFFITKKGLNASISKVGSEGKSAAQTLQEYVMDFRRGIEDERPPDELKTLSDPLHEILIEPFLASNGAIEKLLIIPDASVSYLPFEALMGPSGDYLIEKKTIKYLPSASLLSFIQDPYRETSKEMLAVAGSGFLGNSIDDITRSQDNFASLPATIMEVDSISLRFEKVTTLKNDDVSEAAIKSLRLSDYRYIHLATHGTTNEENPSQSGLILSKNSETESLFGEDGLLNSIEISMLELNADLVVLSACNTGFGRNIAGEGLLGLQRSFIQAGASSVIATLWNVYDKSTAYMMADFYSKLNKYHNDEIGLWDKALMFFDLYEQPLFSYKERALQDAKRKMIEHPYYNHPIHWAPFVLIGK